MIYVFGEHRLDTSLYTLCHAGQTIQLRPKIFQVLLYLLEHRDRVISKQELCEQVWPEQFISEATLASTIRTVRQAVGDTGRQQRVIQTLHGHGYRFMVPATLQPTTEDNDQTPESLSPADAQWLSRDTLCSTPGPTPGGACLGRASELAFLHTLREQVRRGTGGAVCLSGEPGIGTSRLLTEFRSTLHGQPGTYLTEYCLASRHMIPYGLVLELLRHQCGIAPDDPAATITLKVRQRLNDLGLNPQPGPQYLLRLLGCQTQTEPPTGLRPDIIKGRVWALLTQMLLAGRQQPPLILALEDVHWMDHGSAEWLMTIIERLADTPILLLMTSRAENLPGWLDRPEVSQISLQPLTATDSLQLVHTLAPQATLPASLAHDIVTHARGHPLFLETLTRAVLERAVPEAVSAWPALLSEVLTLRLAHLPEGPRQLLQAASVLGPVCALSLLEVLWEGPGAMQPCLLEITQRGFWVEQLQDGEPVYVFSHALLQEAAYTSLALPRRQALHAVVGRAFAERRPGRVESISGLLAYHYAQTGQSRQALEYLTEVAEQATAQGAYLDTVAAVQAALVQVVSLPEAVRERLRCGLLLRHAQALCALRRWQEALTCLQPAPESLAQLQDPGLTGHYELLLSQLLSHLGAWEQALEHAHRAVDAASQGQHDRLVGEACYVLAMGAYWCGQPQQGIEYGQRAVQLLAQTAEPYRLGMAHGVLALHYGLRGACTEALQAATAAAACGASSEERPLQAFAAWTMGWMYAASGMHDAGVAACQRAVAVAADPLSTALALGWLGYAYLEKGEAAAAILHLEQAVEGVRQCHYQRCESLFTTFLGATYLLRGDLVMARTLALRGLHSATATKYHLGMGWAQRTLGQVAHVTGAFEAAAHYLSTALSTFTGLSARLEVGRTHLALGRLAEQQGQQMVAVGQATQAYDLFKLLHLPYYMAQAAGPHPGPHTR